MIVHPQVIHQNGIVTVTMLATFSGAPIDQTDQQRIVAYGDPSINLGGLFTDPNDGTFQFTFPASELYAGITTQMQGYAARFMVKLPLVPSPGSNWSSFASTTPYNPFATSSSPSSQPGGQGQLDCLCSDPVRAATIWAAAIDTRVQAAMAILRAKTPAQLTSLPDATV